MSIMTVALSSIRKIITGDDDPPLLKEDSSKKGKLGEGGSDPDVGVNKLDPSLLDEDSSEEGVLGEGGFGTVRKGNLVGTPVAVKSLREDKKINITEILEEAEVMKKIRHPNVVRFIGVFKIGKEIKIVNDLCDYDMTRVQIMRNDPMFLSNVVKWICQAARGLAYIHDVLKMVHRDVKPGNILLKNGVAQVADFGFTIPVDIIPEVTRRGTRTFVAPELWRGYGYERPVDVYALGMSLYVILSGKNPYHGMAEREIISKVISGERPDLTTCSAFASNPKLCKLIEDCWKQNPSERPTMKDVYDRLKLIYISTIVPESSQAYDFWSKNFADELIDSVPIARIIQAMPNSTMDPAFYDNVITLTQKHDSSDIITLKDFDDMFNWYDSFGGLWYDKDVLNTILTKIESNPWFVKSMDQNNAENRISTQWIHTTTPCFLVRCSKRDSKLTPYTITFHNGEDKFNYRVFRKDKSFVCTNLSPTIVGKDIFDLVDKLKSEGKLPTEPYDPIYDPGVY